MSITIHHLEDEFSNKDGTFATEKITFGRDDKCDIVYSGGDIALEHLELTRTPWGSLQVEVLDPAESAEVDDKTITGNDDPVEIDSGSTIRLGKNGPSFTVWPLEVTIQHLPGSPLAPKMQVFDNSHETISFGRAPENDVVFPPECETVGRRHLLFRRNWFGTYNIEFSKNHYVSVDGKPVRYGFNKQIPSGAVLRLGSRQGPSFKVEWEDARKPGGPAETKFNEFVRDAAGLLEQNKRLVAACLILVFIAISAIGGYLVYRETRLIVAIDDLKSNVYLVVKDDGDAPRAVGTAFAIDTHKLATNAHVTDEIRGALGQFYLVGPNVDPKADPEQDNRIQIVDVQSHPGHAAFGSLKHTFGKIRGRYFTPVDVPGGYDVGIIEVETDLPDWLEPASEDELEDLGEGDMLVSAGFPQEGLLGNDTATKAPALKIAEGIIRAVVDVFQGKPENADDGLIILHDIPVAGGISGSPIIDVWSGNVIAIVSGGNVVPLDVEVLGKKKRTPSAALVNFAHRIDLLEPLEGEATFDVDAAAKHWEEIAKDRGFDRYSDVARHIFMTIARSHLGSTTRDDPEEIEWTVGVLKPQEPENARAWMTGADANEMAATMSLQGAVADSPVFVADTYELQAQPGFGYGFFLETKGIPDDLDADNPYADHIDVKISPNDKLGGEPQNEWLTNPDPKIAAWATVSGDTTLQIKVSGSLDRPCPYKLHVYRWELPSSAPAVAEPVGGTP